MVEMKNCPRCGRLFSSLKDSLCMNCLKAEEEQFETVRKYLKENPGNTVAQVSRDTEVSVKKINRYLREGRLEVTEGLGDYLTCLNCGTPIKTGKFCASCSNKLSKSFEAATEVIDEAAKSGPRMHHFKNK